MCIRLPSFSISEVCSHQCRGVLHSGLRGEFPRAPPAAGRSGLQSAIWALMTLPHHPHDLLVLLAPLLWYHCYSPRDHQDLRDETSRGWWESAWRDCQTEIPLAAQGQADVEEFPCKDLSDNQILQKTKDRIGITSFLFLLEVDRGESVQEQRMIRLYLD